MLPEAFLNRMQKLLGEEYPQFLRSYEEPGIRSLRMNPLKRNADLRGPEDLPFALEPVAWCRDGRYIIDPSDQPGKHPYHDAGVYYIQEASAMAPAGYVQAEPGEKVLDLCAAPGGKSTQLAADMRGEGILVCNDINPARAKILSENIERMGIRNALVTNAPPAELAEYFPAYFDRILVDAPCSGEGMFRRNEEARGEWSEENVRLCAARQDEILDCAARMLRPGGRLVYSTCTFAPQEDEGSVLRFIGRRPEFRILEIPLHDGMERGRAEWAKPFAGQQHRTAAEGIERTVRLFPHKLKGEGHYIAVLIKEGDVPAGYAPQGKYGMQVSLPEKECREWLKFEEEFMKSRLTGTFVRFGDRLYLTPYGTPSLRGLKVLRPGLHLGTVKKDRFEPSHALALTLGEEDVRHCCRLPAEGTQTEAYLKGMTFPAEGDKGWRLIMTGGSSIGWGKLAGGIMKNHYPKGLRRMS